MADRLTKIYTRSGDKGNTSLADGQRVPKDSVLIEAQGDIDELNSIIGLLLAQSLPVDMMSVLQAIQQHLFNLGGELSFPEAKLVQESDVTWQEQWLDHWNKDLTPLKEFILPGGDMPAASAHLARCVCRRAERHLVTLSRHVELRDVLIQYLNRLSDLLFVLARVLQEREGASVQYWQKHLRLPEPGD